MNTYWHQFIFGYYPYIALLIFIVGSMARFEYAQYTWNASSSQLLQHKGMRIGNNLFHIGIILLFFGHLFGLLIPTSLYSVFITPTGKQILAMVVGGILGIICFVGMTMLIYRRLFDARIRATGSWRNILVLLLLYVQLILGLVSITQSVQHLDGNVMLALAHWAQHILTFRSGAADFVSNVNWIFKLHLFLGITIFLILPFTRLVHIWSFPVGYLFRSGYQIVRKRDA